MVNENKTDRSPEQPLSSPNAGEHPTEIGLMNRRALDTSHEVKALVENPSDFESYKLTHFTEEILPYPDREDDAGRTDNQPDRKGTIPESAFYQFPSPKAVEVILVKHNSGKRFFSYGAKGPGNYDDVDKDFPKLKKAPNFVQRQIRKVLGNKEVNEESLHDAYSKWMKEQHDFEVRNNETLFCRSIYTTIKAARESQELEAGRPRHMGVITPFYGNMMNHLQEDAEETFSQFSLEDRDDGWHFNRDSFLDQLGSIDKPVISSLLLCNPNNPTGYVYSPEELAFIVQACKERQILIVADEVWADFVHHPEKSHTPVLKVAREYGYENGIVMGYSPAKAFNTSGGFPCSMATVPDAKLREKMKEKLKRPSHVAAEATVAGFEKAEGHVKHLNQFLRENLEYIKEKLEKMGYTDVHMPDSTYVIYVNFGEDHDSIAKELEASGIRTRNEGVNSGAPGYCRLTAGATRAVIEKCYENWMRNGTRKKSS
jgi:cystathionine beta-lyase